MIRRARLIGAMFLGAVGLIAGVNACGNWLGHEAGSYVFAPAPSAGTLSATNVESTQVTLTWSPPTQSQTPNGLFSYTVYQSSEKNLATVQDCQANGQVLASWQGSPTTFTATGLTALGAYTFNVVASDLSGNLVAYTEVDVFTLSADAPQPGGYGQLVVANRAAESVTLTWTAATDAATAAAQLQYRVYEAAETPTGVALDTVEHVLDNGTPAIAWTAHITTDVLTGLDPNSTYIVNVLVRDAAGTIAAYNPEVVTTSDNSPPTVTGGVTFSSVTSASLVAHWPAASDNFTTAANLTYRAFISTSSNITTLSTAVANGTELTSGWTPAITFISADSLTAATTYSVEVFVSDAADNITAYPLATVATAAADAPVPGGSGVLSFSDGNTTSLTVSWTAATVTPSVPLQYALYYSTSNNIDTVANTLANGTQAAAFTTGLLSAPVTGLNEATLYYFNVLVKPVGGDTAAYNSAGTTTEDVSPPITGNNGVIGVANLTPTSFSLVWTPATDNGTPQNALTYAVYLSTTNSVATYPPSAGTQLLDFTAAVLTVAVTQQLEGKTYYANVFVKDASGNISPYAGAVIQTPAVSIYVFGAGDYTGSLGGRVGADQKCAANIPTGLACAYATHALLSVSSSDSIAAMPATYGLPTNATILGTDVSNTEIASNWAAMLAGPLDVALDQAGVANDESWSGSDANGYVDPNNCQGFSQTGTEITISSSASSSFDTSTVVGVTGYTASTNSDWLVDDTSFSCLNTAQLICVCD